MNSDIPKLVLWCGLSHVCCPHPKDQNIKACFLLCCVFDESSKRLSIIGLTGFVEKIILGFIKIQGAWKHAD